MRTNKVVARPTKSRVHMKLEKKGNIYKKEDRGELEYNFQHFMISTLSRGEF